MMHAPKSSKRGRSLCRAGRTWVVAWAVALISLSSVASGQQRAGKAGGGAGAKADSAERSGASKPNVLLIAIDDLNDYASVLNGFPGIKTPNLEKFAKTTLNFTRAYCAAPVCNPSRSALLSGIAPYRTGVYDNIDDMKQSPLILSAKFLPEQFKASGYKTLTRGKIFHSIPGKERWAAMWDVDAGKGGYGPMPKAPSLPPSMKVPPMFKFQPWTGPETDHPDNETAAEAIKWLGAKHDKPFFMTAGLYKPHNPWTAPKRFFDLYPVASLQTPPVLEGDWDDLPAIAREWAENPVNFDALKKSGKWKEVLQSYLACISFVDWNLGRILTALDASPYKDNTIVCVFADHGFHMGEKKHFAKYALWEKTTHVLCLWRVPGLTQAGATCARPVNLLDVYPTLNELCHLPAPPQQLDGRSIVPLLKDPAAEWKFPSVTTYQQGNQGVRNEQYRYIRYKDGGEELYDEDKDPNEWKNLAADPAMSGVVSELRKHISPTFVPSASGKTGSAD